MATTSSSCVSLAPLSPSGTYLTTANTSDSKEGERKNSSTIKNFKRKPSANFSSITHLFQGLKLWNRGSAKPQRFSATSQVEAIAGSISKQKIQPCSIPVDLFDDEPQLTDSAANQPIPTITGFVFKPQLASPTEDMLAHYSPANASSFNSIYREWHTGTGKKHDEGYLNKKISSIVNNHPWYSSDLIDYEEYEDEHNELIRPPEFREIRDAINNAIACTAKCSKTQTLTRVNLGIEYPFS